MRLISWNCRGLERSAAAIAPKEFVRVVDPIRVFLMETKVFNSSVERVVRKVGFLFFVTVPPRYQRGFGFFVETRIGFRHHLEV